MENLIARLQEDIENTVKEEFQNFYRMTGRLLRCFTLDRGVRPDVPLHS